MKAGAAGALPVRRAVLAGAVLALLLVASGHSAGAQAGTELGRPQGFGANTTGGAGGDTYAVTNLADDGPGSLRAGAESNAPAIIRFEVSGVITLSRRLMVGPNKTIDGRGADVTIAHRGFELRNPNVIIAYLKFADIGDLANVEDREDAILVSGARDIWIDHCTFMRSGDKAIGLPRGTDVTVSWNRFVDLRQVFQMGTFSTADASRDTRVTVHHNSFESDRDRNPQVSYGKLHAYNNLVRHWGVKGMGAIRGAELLSQGNVFDAGENKRAIVFQGGAPEEKDDGPGYVRSEGDLLLNGALIRENEPERVFDPSSYYGVVVEPATDALAQRVLTGSGWQAVDAPAEPSQLREAPSPAIPPAPAPPATSPVSESPQPWATWVTGAAALLLLATVGAGVTVRQLRRRRTALGPAGDTRENREMTRSRR